MMKKNDKTKELINILKENPDRELIFMYPEEGSDDHYTMGYPSRILVDEYWIDDERVWLKLDHEDDILYRYGEKIADELYTEFPLSDEENKIVDAKLNEFVEKIEWKKCICVYLHY